ncbi:MAG TPA: tRNA (adenosine(37)-N6)-threonylcarbamoyltransferase complex transferase subunit TsaD [Phycisphaerales bacterium]|nr:tRNA (adenosine(37)-N6)-threonylcarbamoyltransferase complex transferase subunit TsaD [Phycisphaerales bacterium]
MLFLGLETSCDETAAAIVEDGTRVRSSVIASQHDLHAEYAGVVPEIASRAHVERITPVVRAALRDAGVALADLDAVAVGYRPGLIGSLVVGVAAAKALGWSLGVPIVGVDHVHAHLYAGLLRERDEADHDADALFPALGLVVSGGHTSIYAMESPLALTRLGATIDDALGEAFDKAATILGLPYPGGPALDALARTPGANDRAHNFPVARLVRESLDFSFSGLKTALLYAVRGVPGPGEHASPPVLTERDRADLAASFERAACAAVVLKLGRALAAVRERGPCGALLTGGGVTANTRLRAELTAFARREGLELRLPPPRFCLDNAAMIAGLGHAMLASGVRHDLALSAVPTTAC